MISNLLLGGAFVIGVIVALTGLDDEPTYTIIGALLCIGVTVAWVTL